MKHGQISRNTAKAFFALAALAIVGACSDNSAVAPAAERTAMFAPANFLKVGSSVVFRVNNAEGITKRIGNELISIPAGAICDLSSSYGPDFWNTACTPLRGSVVITATVLEDEEGNPYVDFQPAMRFSPDKEVMLFLRQGKNTKKLQMSIEYCNNLGACVDESLTDSALKPFRLGKTNVIGRRVKHFSGYLINYGEGCRGSVVDNGDGTYWCEDGGFMRRSGYMVASGEDASEAINKGDKKDDKDEQ